jgi:non-haem Fe2+, alpha-ketoglutarate-dependent halogenase
MASSLSPDALARYERDGCLFPLPVLSDVEVASYRAAVEELATYREGGLRRMDLCHLFFAWAHELVTHPAILDVIEGLIGPDIVVHSSRIFYKPPHDPAYVSWHQDGRYSGTQTHSSPTAWIALSDSTRQNGCLRVVAGSHREIAPHIERPDAHNLVRHGQQVTVGIDEARVQDVELRPGQMSLHHVNAIHGSEQNRSDIPRIGYSVSYCTPSLERARFPMVLARGEDRYGRLELMPAPPRGTLQEGLAAHAELERRLGIAPRNPA